MLRISVTFWKVKARLTSIKTSIIHTVKSPIYPSFCLTHGSISIVGMGPWQDVSILLYTSDLCTNLRHFQGLGQKRVSVREDDQILPHCCSPFLPDTGWPVSFHEDKHSNSEPFMDLRWVFLRDFRIPLLTIPPGMKTFWDSLLALQSTPQILLHIIPLWLPCGAAFLNCEIINPQCHNASPVWNKLIFLLCT